MDLLAITSIFAGLALGFGLGMWLMHWRERAKRQECLATLAQRDGEIANLSNRCTTLEQSQREHVQALDAARAAHLQAREQLSRLESDLAHQQSTSTSLREALAEAQGRREALAESLADIQSRFAALEAQHTAEREQHAKQLAVLEEAKTALTHQFKVLANEILEEKSKRFAEQNQNELGRLLQPLGTRLKDFQEQVQKVYVNEAKDRSALQKQVEQLMALNRALSDDAKNLTDALKGSNKTAGGWGELILTRVLEASGLREGVEYDVQVSHTRDDGSRAQPDVVLHLPGDRHLIIDAKVSLTAYDDYVSDNDDTDALRRHLDSVKAHIKGLSEKDYPALYGLSSLDFVLLFVPIEPAFLLAIGKSPELFMQAWEKNVLLVSPSTLLFVVRTVAHLWRQEAQSRNAQDIAKEGAKLYDKFCAFVTDLEDIGKRLRMASEAHDRAFNKLKEGKGNLIGRAEKLKKLGVRPRKTLPASVIGEDDEIDEAEPLPQALAGS